MNWNNRTRGLLWTNTKRLWRAIDKRFFLLPPVLTLVLGALIYAKVYYLPKSVLESTAIVVLCAFVLGLLVRFRLNRHPFFLWAATLCGILLMREVHFAGATELVYLALLAQLYFTLNRLDSLQPYLLDTRIATWVATGFLIYFISITIDQRWWRRLPWEDAVHVPLEETLEVIGHLTIGFALLLAPRTVTSKTE